MMNEKNKKNKVKTRKAITALKPYSPGKPIWEVQQQYGLERVIKLASNENPLGPSPKAMEAISAALPNLHRYPDSHATELLHAISAKLNLLAEQIIVTNGGDELITLVSETFLNPGDEVIVPGPSFTEYEFGALLMDAVPKTVPLKEGFRYDIAAILAAVTEHTKMVYLCTPNNPTGTIITKTELETLLQALPPHVLVMIDAAYSHFALDPEYTDGIEFVRHSYPVIVLQTFSKIYGLAGIRVGFGVASSEIIRSILQVKEPFNVNSLAQAAAIAAIGDDEHVQRSQELVALQRERLYTDLRALGVGYTESMSNFVLVQFGPDARLLYERLMAEGIIVRYGGGWGLPEHVRISIGNSVENDALIEALRGLLEH